LDGSVGGERGGHPLFPPILLGEGKGREEVEVEGERAGHLLFPPIKLGEGGGGKEAHGLEMAVR
jgi:hypothetical protein